MAVLGIITCAIFENEFSYILKNDLEINTITVIEDNNSRCLIELLNNYNIEGLHMVPHISSFLSQPTDELDVVIRVLDISLHCNKHILLKTIIDVVTEMKRYVDAFLLGYGLCGNSLGKLKEDICIDIPVFRPMDKNNIADDCVSILLGGADCYYAEQCKKPGTYFITPGWSSHWKDLFTDVSEIKFLKVIKRVFKNYERLLLIKTPVMSESVMEKKVNELNEHLNLSIEKQTGTIDILISTWERAKSFLKR